MRSTTTSSGFSSPPGSELAPPEQAEAIDPLDEQPLDRRRLAGAPFDAVPVWPAPLATTAREERRVATPLQRSLRHPRSRDGGARPRPRLRRHGGGRVRCRDHRRRGGGRAPRRAHPRRGGGRAPSRAHPRRGGGRAPRQWPSSPWWCWCSSAWVAAAAVSLVACAPPQPTRDRARIPKAARVVMLVPYRRDRPSSTGGAQVPAQRSVPRRACGSRPRAS